MGYAFKEWLAEKAYQEAERGKRRLDESFTWAGLYKALYNELPFKIKIDNYCISPLGNIQLKKE